MGISNKLNFKQNLSPQNIVLYDSISIDSKDWTENIYGVEERVVTVKGTGGAPGVLKIVLFLVMSSSNMSMFTL